MRTQLVHHNDGKAFGFCEHNGARFCTSPMICITQNPVAFPGWGLTLESPTPHEEAEEADAFELLSRFMPETSVA